MAGFHARPEPGPGDVPRNAAAVADGLGHYAARPMGGFAGRFGAGQGRHYSSVAFIDTVLKPRFLPVITPTQFNYPIDIQGKWHGSKYRFLQRYRPGFPDNLGEEFDAPFMIQATLLVVSPFVARELMPLMHLQVSGDEDAAVTLGAVTLANVKWALLYGLILCAARSVRVNVIATKPRRAPIGQSRRAALPG